MIYLYALIAGWLASTFIVLFVVYFFKGSISGSYRGLNFSKPTESPCKSLTGIFVWTIMVLPPILFLLFVYVFFQDLADKVPLYIYYLTMCANFLLMFFASSIMSYQREKNST